MGKPHTFKPDLASIRELSFFVLNKIADQPINWVRVGKEYQDQHSFYGDSTFNRVFARLFTLMREEGWIGNPSDNENFLVGLTFKGRTVIRHPSEIDAFYARHFQLRVTQIKKEVRKREHLEQQKAAQEKKAHRRLDAKRKHLEQQKAAQERKAQKKLAAVQAKEARRKKNLIQQKSDGEKRGQSALVESGKRIRSLLPQYDNAQLLNLWKANTSRAAGSKGGKKQEHLLIVSAVEKEWRRRVSDLPESDAFKWPTTDVGCGVGGGDFERADESFLKVLGYTVGKTNGLSEATRRMILDRCFLGQLPPIENLCELRLWGEAGTPLRLQKIAYHIAGVAKNFKKMPSGDYETAISDWEDDLQYLYDTYYVRHFGFDWPS